MLVQRFYFLFLLGPDLTQPFRTKHVENVDCTRGASPIANEDILKKFEERHRILGKELQHRHAVPC